MIAKKKLPRSLRAEMIPLALGLLFSISCAPSLLRRAETLRNNQYYEEALDYYLQALKTHPDRVEIKIAIDRLMKELEFDPGNNEVKKRLTEVTERKPEVKSVDRIKKEMELNVGLPDVFRD